MPNFGSFICEDNVLGWIRALAAADTAGIPGARKACWDFVVFDGKAISNDVGLNSPIGCFARRICVAGNCTFGAVCLWADDGHHLRGLYPADEEETISVDNFSNHRAIADLGQREKVIHQCGGGKGGRIQQRAHDFLFISTYLIFWYFRALPCLVQS